MRVVTLVVVRVVVRVVARAEGAADAAVVVVDAVAVAVKVAMAKAPHQPRWSRVPIAQVPLDLKQDNRLLGRSRKHDVPGLLLRRRRRASRATQSGFTRSRRKSSSQVRKSLRSVPNSASRSRAISRC
jgi:hypothetical protein